MANERGNNESGRLYFLGLQNQCRWWLQPWNWTSLAPGGKAMINLDSILESRDITLLTNVHTVMYRCESYSIKAEHQRTDTFKLWCWERLLRVPWTARRSKPSILKKINPEYSLEGLTLKLKLQYLAPILWSKEPNHWKRPWCWERLKARGEGDDRGWDGWMASSTQWAWVWANSWRW